MNDPLLQLLMRGVFVLVFALTLIDFLRARDLPHFEVAALFGGLALLILAQAASEVSAAALPAWITTPSILALLAQPYLLVRVLGHFRTVPRSQHTLALAALIASWVVYLAFGATGPSTIALVVAFVYVEGYATFAFVASVLVHRGITQRRLIAVALGSGCLAAAMVAAGLMATLPRASVALLPLTNVFALVSALAYYVGLAPPRWLRRTWQQDELRQFLLGLSGLSGTVRVMSVLEYLGPAAARATGAQLGIVALAREKDARILDLQGDAQARELLHERGLLALDIDRSSALQRAWRDRASLTLSAADDWGDQLGDIRRAIGARAAIVAPLITGDYLHGLFVVFLARRASLFVMDDLEVLAMLAEQAALAIESGKLAEESARERSTLNAVMASMHEALLVMDGEGVIRYSNLRSVELLGIPQGELIGSNARALFTRLEHRLHDPDVANAQWRRALRRAEMRPTLSLELISPARSLSAEVFAVSDTAGDQRGIGAVLRDVTAERDLVRTKDELVSVVSHELRTPLASVVGFAELLRTRELSDAQRQQFLTVILEEGRRLTALINDFLDLQRMESGRQEIVPRPLALQEFLEHAVQTAGMDAQRPVSLDVPARLPEVRADSDRIHQVVANLLSNARKYSPAGGPVELSAYEDSGQVIVSVRDHGLGLPPDAVPHLFEKFFRVDNSDRRSITGTGLGLAISRKIVEAHGGRIWADSDGLGKGSCFSFSLPVADVRTTSGDVLIVEDDAGFARLLKAALAEHDISVVWVASAEDALVQLQNETPKALVLDLLLPGVQGEEFLERMRQRHDGSIPVVIISVKDLNEAERAALQQLNVVALLRKSPDVGGTAAELLAETLREKSGTGRLPGVAA